MGTRADFYIGRGAAAEWLGSIAWDGYPEGIPSDVLKASNQKAFKKALATFTQDRADFSKPDDGWPWPWDNSATTDYAYAFDGKHVWGSSFGGKWFDTRRKQPEEPKGKTPTFPGMSKRKNIQYGKRSGLLIFRS